MDTKFILTIEEETLRRILREELRPFKRQVSADQPETDASSVPEIGWIRHDVAIQKYASRSTFQRWRQKGLLPHTKVGGLIFYRVADLQKLFERNLRGGT